MPIINNDNKICDSNSHVSIKLHWNPRETPEIVDLESFKTTIIPLALHIPDGFLLSSICFIYHDEDDDIIQLNSDNEFEEFLRYVQVKKGSIKMKLNLTFRFKEILKCNTPPPSSKKTIILGSNKVESDKNSIGTSNSEFNTLEYQKKFKEEIIEEVVSNLTNKINALQKEIDDLKQENLQIKANCQCNKSLKKEIIEEISNDVDKKFNNLQLKMEMIQNKSFPINNVKEASKMCERVSEEAKLKKKSRNVFISLSESESEDDEVPPPSASIKICRDNSSFELLDLPPEENNQIEKVQEKNATVLPNSTSTSDLTNSFIINDLQTVPTLQSERIQKTSTSKATHNNLIQSSNAVKSHGHSNKDPEKNASQCEGSTFINNVETQTININLDSVNYPNQNIGPTNMFSEFSDLIHIAADQLSNTWSILNKLDNFAQKQRK